MNTQTVQRSHPLHAIGALLLLLATLLLAAPQVRAGDQPAAGTASAVVSSTIETVMTRLNNDTDEWQGNPEALYALVSEVVLPHIDIPRISRMALGKAARQADKETLARFADEFRLLLIRTYATSLSQYAGEAMNFPIREKPQGNNKASVHLNIERPGQPAIAMEFRLHNKSGPWQVFDIKIEGISLVANYRSEFAGVVRNQGLEALIAQLSRKNADVRVAAR